MRIANASAQPVASTGPATPPQIDPDGDDDPGEADRASFRSVLSFERVGRAPAALQRICDLTPLGDSLYAAHSNQPLGTDGATISRYRPDDPKRPFSIAFDWNRTGEPTKGGGAGQGFLRVHAIGGRLFVPDADPPYAGFGISDWGTEGFVFVSDANGSFAAARMPGHRPPGPPTPAGAGAARRRIGGQKATSSVASELVAPSGQLLFAIQQLLPSNEPLLTSSLGVQRHCGCLPRGTSARPRRSSTRSSERRGVGSNAASGDRGTPD